MDEGFLEAIAHPRAPFSERVRARLTGAPVRSAHVILGVRLRPLSLWHEALLDAIDSPFAHKPDRKQPHDRQSIFTALYQAIEICRLLPPYLPEADSFLAQWRRRRAFLTFYIKSKRRNAPPAKLCLIREKLKFFAYLNDYRPAPVYLRSKDGQPIKSPTWLYQLSLFKRFNPDADLKTIWAMSPGQIAWQNAGALEASGVPIEIMTEARYRAYRKAGAI